jgi:hypothetical protein
VNVGYRESILSPRGYDVTYETRLTRGTGAKRVCVAIKDGVMHFAFKIRHECPDDHPDHYQHIQSIQTSIPHMARMVGPIGDVVLLEAARGEMLWHMAYRPDPSLVEDQLTEFALATKDNDLINGDIRPWNVFFDNDHGVQVIDWWCLSSFVSDLIGERPRRRDLVEGTGHYARLHPDLVSQRKFTDIDLSDVKLIGRLLRGEIELSDSEAWLGEYRSMGRFLWR